MDIVDQIKNVTGVEPTLAFDTTGGKTVVVFNKGSNTNIEITVDSDQSGTWFACTDDDYEDGSFSGLDLSSEVLRRFLNSYQSEHEAA